MPSSATVPVTDAVDPASVPRHGKPLRPGAARCHGSNLIMGLTAPWATVIVAAVALLVGGATVWQKWRTDQRDAWWKRAHWAIDKSLSAHPVEREIGSES